MRKGKREKERKRKIRYKKGNKDKKYRITPKKFRPHKPSGPI